MRRVRFTTIRTVLPGLVGCALVATAVAIGPPASAAESATAAARVAPAVAPAGGTYVAVGPTRLLDTGSGLGAPKAAVGARKTLTFQVTGQGDVPASGVAAVVLNLTVASPTAGGYITAYPAGGTRPTTSSLNFAAGKTVPNLVVARLGTGGKVSLYNGSAGTVRLVADVQGYYTSGTATQPGAYAALAPVRILDTGAGLGAAKAPVAGGKTVTFHVTGHGGVPTTGVSAVVLNVTAAAPTSGGYVTAYPAGTSRPVTSSLNFVRSRTVANSVVVRLGSGGEVSLYNGSAGSVRLVADVAGYYRSGTVTQPGAFTALNPTRVLDTGSGNGAPKAPVASYDTVNFTMAGRGGVPATGVSAVVLNLTVASAQAGGHITAGPGISIPQTSNLNFVAGQSVANLVVVRLRPDGKINLRNWSLGTVRLIADVAGYYRARPDTVSFSAPVTDTHEAGGAGAVSCPSSTFCAAVAGVGEVTTYNGTVWSAPHIVDAGVTLTSISCASASFCVAVGDHDAVTFNGATWSGPSAIDPAGGLTGVSCGSSARCVAVDSGAGPSFFTVGHAFVDNAGTWTTTAIDATGIAAVSCPSATYCAVGDDQGDFFTFDGSAWTDVQPGDNPLGFGGPTAISCTSSSFCAAADSSQGTVRTYDGSTWSDPTTIDTTTGVSGLSCASATFCELATYDIGVSTFAGSSWSTPAPVMAAGSSFRVAVSCATTTFCEVVSNDGYGSAGHDSTWSAMQDVDPTSGYSQAFSCPTTSYCLSTTDAGFGVPFTGTAWGSAVPLLPRHDTRAVSCPTATFCLATDTAGDTVSFNGSTATTLSSDGLGGDDQTEVSCASPTFCVAVEGTSSATFNGTSWSAPVGIGTTFTPAIACPAAGFCLAVDGHTSRAFNGTSWSGPTTIGNGSDSFSTLSCSSATFCLATGNPDFAAEGGTPGGEDYAIYNGTSWTGPVTADSGGWVSSVSCASSAFCLGTEPDGTTITWDGNVWTDPTRLEDGSAGDGPIVRCPSTGTCIVFGVAGTYVGIS